VRAKPRRIDEPNYPVGLYAANMADTIADGIAQAGKVIGSGAAKAKMEEFVRYNA
jgi:anthranilate phosphoribosyltransferase